MRRLGTLSVLVAIGLTIAVTSIALANDKPPVPAVADPLGALERKLLGTWQGGACQGNFTFRADHTYEMRHFTPGQNTMTGTWSIRWDALPPKLVILCKTSDFRSRDPTREEYRYLGVPLELKLMELNSDTFVYRYPDSDSDQTSERPEKK